MLYMDIKIGYFESYNRLKCSPISFFWGGGQEETNLEESYCCVI